MNKLRVFPTPLYPFLPKTYLQQNRLVFYCFWAGYAVSASSIQQYFVPLQATSRDFSITVRYRTEFLLYFFPLYFPCQVLLVFCRFTAITAWQQNIRHPTTDQKKKQLPKYLNINNKIVPVIHSDSRFIANIWTLNLVHQKTHHKIFTKNVWNHRMNVVECRWLLVDS